MTAECFRRQAEVTYQYDAENRLTAVYDQQKLLMASTYDGDGNRAFQLNYNPAAVCGYGIGWGDEIYMPEHSQNEDESLTAEGLLFSYVCSDTGRAYDLTEYVNDTNREYTEVLTAYTINGGATESYSYAGNKRLSRNNIWTEARDVVPNETSYYLYDGRGSVTANTWYNGMVTDVFQYDPYGQVTLGSTEHADFYGYNGESYNPNTGLEFLRARYYNADMGRFFQEDSYLGKIAEPLTLNRYAYGKNSPMNYADPSGHDPYTYEVNGYYFIGPDNKGTNLTYDAAGFILPFGDMLASWADEKSGHIEYFNNSTATETVTKAIGDGISAGELRLDILLKLGYVDEAAKVTNKIKALRFIGTMLGIIGAGKDVISDTAYTSQVTYLLYKNFLTYDKNKENLIARYTLLNSLVGEAIKRGAITYCKGHFYEWTEFTVIPESIKIVDIEEYHNIMEEFGYSPVKLMELLAKTE